jgi:hypothetical protein
MLDMYVVFITFLYTMKQSIFSDFYNRHIYYTCNILGIICYTLARKNNCKDKSSLYHCGIHVISNIGNVVLYSGFNK